MSTKDIYIAEGVIRDIERRTTEILKRSTTWLTTARHLRNLQRRVNHALRDDGDFKDIVRDDLHEIGSQLSLAFSASDLNAKEVYVQTARDLFGCVLADLRAAVGNAGEARATE